MWSKSENCKIQYVVLGLRIKIIMLNILSESKRHEQKVSLKIAFMLLTIMLKWQTPNANIFLVIRKEGDRARGSLVRESYKTVLFIYLFIYLFSQVIIVITENTVA